MMKLEYFMTKYKPIHADLQTLESRKLYYKYAQPNFKIIVLLVNHDINYKQEVNNEIRNYYDQI